MPFAEGTTVEVSKSQADIAALLVKHGASGYQYGWDDNRAAVMFRSHGKVVRFSLTMPDPGERRFHVTENGRARQNPDSAYQAEIRRRWRALYMVIKAKLVAVDDEVTTFEEEFYAHIVMPGTGRTLFEETQAQLEHAYATGDPVDLLPQIPAPPAALAIEGV